MYTWGQTTFFDNAPATSAFTALNYKKSKGFYAVESTISFLNPN